jgi:hypothetical protein
MSFFRDFRDDDDDDLLSLAAQHGSDSNSDFQETSWAMVPGLKKLDCGGQHGVVTKGWFIV